MATTTNKRQRGTVTSVSEKGYCFATMPDGERAFCHATDCPDETLPAVGQVVEFDLVLSPKGRRGCNITLVDVRQE